MGAPQRNARRVREAARANCAPPPTRARTASASSAASVAMSRRSGVGRYEEAIAKYSEAIALMKELDPDDDDEIEAGGRHLQ